MNWIQRIAGSLGVDRLPEMIAMAFESLEVAQSHPKGTFSLMSAETDDWTVLQGKPQPAYDYKESYANDERDLRINLIYYRNREWSDSIQIRVNVTDGAMQYGTSVFSKRSDVSDMPMKVVETAYQLINLYFDDDDEDDDGNTPEWSPDPMDDAGVNTPVGAPVGVGV